METKIQKLPNSRAQLAVTVPGSDMIKYFDEAIEKLGTHIEIKGFRPGKAPRQLKIEKIGAERILTQALEFALPEVYTEAIKKADLSPIASPDIKIEQYPVLDKTEADLIFKAEVDVFPPVKLGDYKKIKVRKDKFAPKIITEKQVDEFIGYLQKQKSKFKKIDRPVKNGDRVEIDFAGSLDNVVQESMTSKNHPLILGDKTLIPGFEEKLVGLKVGDETNFDINFPKDYHAKEFAGKKAKFQVKMNLTEEIELPVVDDHFVKDFGHKSVDELKKAIGENLQKEENERSSQMFENEIILEALKMLETEIPKSFTDKELEHMVEDIKQRAYMQGLTFEKYLEYLKKSEEELKKELIPQAEQLVKVSLLLGEVIKREGLDGKDKDAPKKAVAKMVEYSAK